MQYMAYYLREFLGINKDASSDSFVVSLNHMPPKDRKRFIDDMKRMQINVQYGRKGRGKQRFESSGDFRTINRDTTSLLPMTNLTEFRIQRGHQTYLIKITPDEKSSVKSAKTLSDLNLDGRTYRIEVSELADHTNSDWITLKNVSYGMV